MPVVLSQLLIQFQLPARNSSLVLTPLNDTSFDLNSTTLPTLANDDILTATTVDELINADNTGANILSQSLDFVIFMWNDVFWLSTIIVLMTLLACFVNHHMDLRQRNYFYFHFFKQHQNKNNSTYILKNHHPLTHSLSISLSLSLSC